MQYDPVPLISAQVHKYKVMDFEVLVRTKTAARVSGSGGSFFLWRPCVLLAALTVGDTDHRDQHHDESRYDECRGDSAAIGCVVVLIQDEQSKKYCPRQPHEYEGPSILARVTANGTCLLVHMRTPVQVRIYNTNT